MVQKLSSEQQNKLPAVISLIGLVLLVGVVWTWWHFLRSDVERTFYGALENNLKTRYVTRQMTESSEGQSFDQRSRTSLGPEQVVMGYTTISGQDGTKVQTESIGTPRADYVRYTTIKTGSSEPTDFKDALNIWGKTETTDKSQTTGELYGGTVLGIVPYGDLPAPERAKLMDFVRSKKVYQFDEAKVKREVKQNRPVYTYPVTVSMEAWADFLKRFARELGLTQLESVDPAAYRGEQPVELSLTIDVWSRQITGIGYGEQRQERLSSHGVRSEITLPSKSVPADELLQRLQPEQ